MAKRLEEWDSLLGESDSGLFEGFCSYCRDAIVNKAWLEIDGEKIHIECRAIMNSPTCILCKKNKPVKVYKNIHRVLFCPSLI